MGQLRMLLKKCYVLIDVQLISPKSSFVVGPANNRQQKQQLRGCFTKNFGVTF